MATIHKHHRRDRIPDADHLGDYVERPAFTREAEGPEIETCGFCGEPYAAAFWRGHKPVSVCRACALDILPRLIADALIGEHGTADAALGNLHLWIDKMSASFWRAAAIAIHRTARAERKERGE